MNRQAHTPPVLPPDVFAVGRSRVLVTGASGRLGRAVVDELLQAAIPTRTFVHRREATKSPDQVSGNIATGAGLDVALDGVGVVIHCATDPAHAQRVDVAGTQSVLDAVDAWAPGAHVIYPSIVGAWENPLPYYRAKADAENLLDQWGGRASIVRATQFHPLIRRVVSGNAGRLTAGMDDVHVAPVDPAFVAEQLVDVALAHHPLAEPLNIAGPEDFSLAEVATLTAHLDTRRAPRRVHLPKPSGVIRAFARGSAVPPPSARRGGVDYATWVTASA